MTPRSILPNELLMLAEDLAKGARPGRPHTVSLRGAVASSYYALFHRLCRDAAIGLLATAKSPAAHTVVRWITHQDLRDLCSAVNQPASKIRSVLGEPSAELSTVVTTFNNLQDARHRADYDHDYNLTRAAAANLVRQPKDAVALADAMRVGRDPSYLIFRRLVLGAIQIQRRAPATARAAKE